MKIQSVNASSVGLDFGQGPVPVGRLAVRDRRIYFEYQPDFLDRGLDISPLMLPLRPGLETFDPLLFEGLPGVFNDSLPDGWGRLLIDRALRAQGILPEAVGPLDRLALVGARGMGALTYLPDHAPEADSQPLDLDRLASDARQVLAGQADDVLPELIALNGSSAGARPKAMIGYNPETGAMIHGAGELPDGYQPWLVKFANTRDGADAGRVEYVYSLMATEAGIDMPATQLLQTDGGAYFATRRFDRDRGTRLHTHTATGLLHSDHRVPALDYETLLALTRRLTRDSRQVERMFRLAAFNVLAHNRDDHGKNFTFLMNSDGDWTLSPAYDLTFSSGPGGEQTTTVMGEGRAPGVAHLKALARKAGIANADAIIDQTQAALADWDRHARAYEIPAPSQHLISQRLQTGA